ncbi:S1 RNA-binding domain-containing protein [Myxococcota bacterium]|nr:S1 RNA-binding domain-containing protein [Myxococcota bacterium]MBU1534462.1 S1 RNA-binding domain-containing protein [Myxococcota bacterium]
MDFTHFLDKQGEYGLISVFRAVEPYMQRNLRLEETPLPGPLCSVPQIALLQRVFHLLRKHRHLEQARAEIFHQVNWADSLPEGFDGEGDLLFLFSVVHEIVPSPGGYDPHTLQSVAKALSGCLAISWKHCVVRAAGLNPGAPVAQNVAELVGNQGELAEISPHRWFALRRARQESRIEIFFELPQRDVAQHLALYSSDFQKLPGSGELPSLYESVIAPGLQRALVLRKDMDAAEAIYESARFNYRTLLTGNPVESGPVLGVYVGHDKGRIGVVWGNKSGALQKTMSLDPREDLRSKLSEALEAYPVTHAILPQRAVAMDTLEALSRFLGGHCAVTRIREAAMTEARDKWMGPPHGFSSEIAGAAALLNRALFPLTEWGRVDPLSLGLAEYPEFLQADLFRAIMADERFYCSKLLKERNHRMGAEGNDSRSLNAVSAFSHLQEGMSLAGIVTNITDYGAFVSLGIKEEGLIHVSELADTYVKHPSEIVTLGQRVVVRVLSLDAAARRISLSMRDPRRPRPRTAAAKKAMAMKGLEDLFKK